MTKLKPPLSTLTLHLLPSNHYPNSICSFSFIYISTLNCSLCGIFLVFLYHHLWFLLLRRWLWFIDSLRCLLCFNDVFFTGLCDVFGLLGSCFYLRLIIWFCFCGLALLLLIRFFTLSIYQLIIIFLLV